ncbi:PilZ domain-containing protein [Fibrobacterota bacterium]
MPGKKLNQEKTYQGAERRRAARLTLTTFCPSTFKHTRKEYPALMVDLSEYGAQFKALSSNETMKLEKGMELEFSVNTPYGTSNCKGRVAWHKKIDDFYSWGVEFTNFSKDEKDPLRCFIDSPF